MEKKFDGNYTRMPLEILEAVPHKAADERPLITHHENYPS